MSTLTSTKHASITAWATAIPALRMHFANPAAHCGPLEPFPEWLDGLVDEDEAEAEGKAKVGPIVPQTTEQVEVAEGQAEIAEEEGEVEVSEGEGGEGNVIDWTYFHPTRTVPYAPWEFRKKREEGFFTEMSGLSDVELSSESSSDSESESSEEDEEDDESEEQDAELSWMVMNRQDEDAHLGWMVIDRESESYQTLMEIMMDVGRHERMKEMMEDGHYEEMMREMMEMQVWGVLGG